tara:strand:- start:4344 stop:4616 length:273 start_codon:yes stop_codon:yes gene_type:complete
MKGFYLLQNPTFEQHQQRGVYLAQCRTFEVAKMLSQTFNNVLQTEDIMNGCRKAPYNLRIVRKHRDEHSQAFRDAVASEMRSIRAKRKLH